MGENVCDEYGCDRCRPGMTKEPLADGRDARIKALEKAFDHTQAVLAETVTALEAQEEHAVLLLQESNRFKAESEAKSDLLTKQRGFQMAAEREAKRTKTALHEALNWVCVHAEDCSADACDEIKARVQRMARGEEP